MATYAMFEFDLNGPSHPIGSRPQIAIHREGVMPPLQQSYAAAPENLAACAIERSKARRRLRRRMTREEGCAIEMIGHAVDYLNDCYLYQGPADEFLDFQGSCIEAVQLLISAQRRVLESVPLTEVWSSRLWNGLLRQVAEFRAAVMVRLTSIR